MDELYEAINMTRAQAEAVAEVLSCGSVVWSQRHTYPTGTAIVRPMGCKCPQCSARDAVTKQKHPFKTCVHKHNWSMGPCPHCADATGSA